MEEFEVVYEVGAARARRVLASEFTEDVIKDAIQDTALYFMERLDQHTYITDGLFLLRVHQRALNIHSRAHQHYEEMVGTSNDLAQLEDIGDVEGA
jgi:hypothetical protein